MKNIIPKLLLLTALVLVFSTVSEPLLSYADTDRTETFEDGFFSDTGTLENLTFEDLDKLSDNELEDLGIYIGSDAEEFNEEILDDDFDFEGAVEKLDISKMGEDEKDKFMVLVKETVAISGTEEVELLEEALLGLFDSASETFNNLEATQTQLEEKYIEKLVTEDNSIVSKVQTVLFGAEAVYAAKKKKKKGKIAVGVNVAGVAFNLAISGVVGGGVSAVKAYIKKKGQKKAVEGLSRVATAQAKKLKINSIRGVAIATVMHTAIQFALSYSDVGGGVARFIDGRDWYKNNGWIDVTK
ncbi:hypothetical protein [Cytobacillus horneckiae]|uniref:Uncharacterized protein n=1 Tax=Cytobacillus horneckiae TaxID=549687 RepID=A0A2N0ZN34_9BACI|nr:hypothetical protein [Cytobacillus horneckiae]MEC1157574.1 hypothetical protein [Cytobacillus horneckiae]MED2939522.1 hypothetical protein [Cytobacillus horneckiae]PKG30915.1 hypothetical protein CWS20_00435 [Cytobacillus horneckiae]